MRLRTSKLRDSRRGFTLIELLIASTVFSVILLGAAAALIQVGRMYQKGVISARTQETARSVMDDMSRKVQFSNDQIIVVDEPVNQPYNQAETTEVRAVCIGNTRYTYAVNAQVTNDLGDPGYSSDSDNQDNRIRHGLWQDRVVSPQNCLQEGDEPLPDLTSEQPSEGGRELLGQNMRFKDFSVTVDQEKRMVGINIDIVYGDHDLIIFENGQPQRCTSSVIGGQWCATAGLSTNVFQRTSKD